MIKSIIIIAISFLTMTLFATESSIESINIKDHSLLHISRPIVYDPLISINPNLGVFKTSFNLPLPKNFTSFEKLTFSYNSSNEHNIGYGVGFTLDLPQIKKNLSPNRLLPYSYSGLGGGELIDLGELTSEHKAIAQRISSIFLLTESPLFTMYRPQIEDNFNLFIRVQANNQATVGWLIFTPQGEKWVLSATGRAIYLLDKSLNWLKFSWSGIVLHSVSDSTKSWQYKFDYLAPQSNILPKWQDEAFINPFTAIKSATVFNGEDVIDSFSFSYQQNYLTMVKRVGAKFPIFSAFYSSLEEKEVGSQADQMIKNENQWIDYNSDGKVDFLTLELNSLSLFIQNFKFEFDHLGRATPQSVKKFKDGVSANCFYNAKIQLTAKDGLYADASLSTIYLRILGQLTPHFEEAHKETVSDIQFENNGEFKPVAVAVSKTIEYPRVKEVSSQNRVFSVDINGDGKIDLVACPNNPKIDEKSFKLESGEKLSNLYAQVLTFNKSNKISENDFTSPLDFTGGQAILFQQEMDLKALKNRDSKNLFKLKKRNTDLRCNQHSLFFDANRDGKIDVITGKDLFLGNGEGDFLKDESIDIKDFFQQHDNSLDIQKPLALIDLHNSGKFILINADHISSDVIPGHTSIYFNQKRTDYPKRPRHKLLTQLQSPFGATQTMIYSQLEGELIVESVKTHANGFSTTERFQYLTPRYNREMNLFTGFTDVIKKVEHDSSSIEDQTISLQFVADIALDEFSFSERGRLNGIISSEKISSTADLSRYQKTHYRFAYEDLGDGRIYPYPYETDKTLVDNLGNDQVFQQSRSTRSYKRWIQDSNNRSFIPLIEESQYYSSINPKELLLKHILTSRCKNAYSEYQYFLATESCQKLSATGEEDTAAEVSSYDQTGNLVSKCQGERCSNFHYDNLGRLTKLELTNLDGGVIFYRYANSGPSISAIKSEKGVEEYHYDLFGSKIIRAKKVDGTTYDYLWNKDGLLEALNKNGSNFYQLLSYSSAKASFLTEDQESEVLFDQTGRVKQRNQESLIGGMSIYSPEGLLLIKHQDNFHQRSESIEAEFSYDFLHRPVRESFFPESDSSLIKSYQWRGTKRTESNNGIKVADLLTDLDPSRLLEEKYFGENFGYRLNSHNAITAIEIPGHSWNYNQFGEVITFSFNQQNEFSSSSTLFTRSINPLGNIINYADGTTVEKRHDGRTKLVSSPLSSSLTDFRAYQQAKEISQTLSNKNSHRVMETAYSHDQFGRLEKIQKNEIATTYSYDSFDRVAQVEVFDQSRKIDYQVNYEYKNGLIQKALPYIARIERDAYNRITEVHYADGTKLNRTYFARGLLKKVTLSYNGKILFSEEYTLNELGQYASADSFSPLAKEIRPIAFSYDEYFKIAKGSTIKRDILDIEIEGENLSRVASNQFFYDGDSRLVASCKEGEKLEAGNCFLLHDTLSYSYKSVYAQLIQIDEIAVGVLINGVLYPIVADKLGSIRTMIDAESKELLWHRNYGIWGEKSVELSTGLRNRAKNLEKMTIWNWAKLTSPANYFPADNNLELYWSQSRAYSPKLKEWLTIDPIGKWNPNAFLSLKGNWNFYRYCNNDPVNFVDPSGKFAVTTALLTVGGVNAIAMGSAWVASKVAMWVGGVNTPQNNSNLNKAMMVGVGAGFAPAVVAGGIEAGMAFRAVGMKHIYRNAPIYAGINRIGGDLMSGAYDSALPSNAWQSLGWAIENRDTISSSINRFSNDFSSFIDSYNESDVDDGFRFYDQPRRDSNFSFGDWNFE